MGERKGREERSGDQQSGNTRSKSPVWFHFISIEPRAAGFKIAGMSVGPPAANGMIMVIGRSRNFCALACELNASMVAATATTDFTPHDISHQPPRLRDARSISG